MSRLKFDPSSTSIIVSADIKASLPTVAKLILDTGASYVTLPWNMVSAIGIPIDTKNTVQLTSASTVETIPKIVIPEMTVLGKRLQNIEAIVKDLPPEAPADGLLGLSFLKNFKLTINFKKNYLTLE